jgi:3-oxoacyl-[acyl-carrier-protein] synthase-3
LSSPSFIAGSGSFVCTPLVRNDEVLAWLRPTKPNGKPVHSEWLERNLGISTRSFDLDMRTAVKRPRAEGGIYDGDLAVRAAKKALENAGMEALDIDALVHVSCTPDTLYFNDHLRFMTRELGLRRDAHLMYHNLGCAGLAPAFHSARSELAGSGDDGVVLLVASNCSSSYLTRDTIPFYMQGRYPWAWLSPALFGDGAGAVILRSGRKSGDRGLVHTWYETQPDLTIVRYDAGGGTSPTCADNLTEHLFLMEAQTVGRSFTPVLCRTFERMVEDWPTRIQPVVGHAFDVDKIKRWYFHQANRIAVERTARTMGLPVDRVPTNVGHYGNTSAASTLLLFDEDRRSGAVKDGDIVVFLWIGAGNGAQYGYALVVA